MIKLVHYLVDSSDMVLPVISVIVPIYGVEPYLKKCLDSIINQTYKNLEIILIDDGSPDRCGEICDEYAAKDSRIIVIHQENEGLSEARNAGLNIATGEYLLFVDSDDWIEYEACETVLALALQQHAEMVCFAHKRYNSSGETIIRAVDRPGVIEKTELIRQLVWETGVIKTSIWNKFYARKLFQNIRFPKGRNFEDLAVFAYLVHSANIIYVTNAILYNYYIRKESIMSIRFQPRGVLEMILSWKDRLKLIQHFYPKYADKQMACILREMIIGSQIVTGDYYVSQIIKEKNEFVKVNKPRLRFLTHYSHIVWLWYYCRPLAICFVKILYIMNRKVW